MNERANRELEKKVAVYFKTRREDFEYALRQLDQEEKIFKMQSGRDAIGKRLGEYLQTKYGNYGEGYTDPKLDNIAMMLKHLGLVVFTFEEEGPFLMSNVMHYQVTTEGLRLYDQLGAK